MPSERNILKTAKPNEDEYELRKGFITITIHDKCNIAHFKCKIHIFDIFIKHISP